MPDNRRKPIFSDVFCGFSAVRKAIFPRHSYRPVSWFLCYDIAVSYEMAVRLQRQGGVITFLSCYDYNVIAARWLCNRSALEKPSYRLDKAMMLRLLCDDAAITMRWLIFLIYFHSKDTAKRFPDVTTPYYSRHFNLQRKKLGFCDSWAAFLKKNNRRSDLTTHIILPHQSRYYSRKYKITSGVLIDFGTLPYLILWINTWYYDITILNTKNKIYEKRI